MPKQQKKDQAKRFNRKIYIGIGIVVCVLLVFGELMTGNIPYYIKWQQCGRQPVIVTHTTPIGLGYTPPIYTAYPHPGFFDSKIPVILKFGGPTAYCSLDEARQKYGADLEVWN